MSALARRFLLKIFENKFVREDFEMETLSDLEDMREIIFSKNEDDVKDLINSVKSDNKIFSLSLTKLNNELSGNKNRPKRKELNVFLMKCLVQTQTTYQLALIWLKKRVDFQTCDTVISDYNFTGTLIQNTKEKIFTVKENIETSLAEWIRKKCHKLIARG